MRLGQGWHSLADTIRLDLGLKHVIQGQFSSLLWDYKPLKLFKAALGALWHANAIWDDVHQVRSSAALAIRRIRNDYGNSFPASFCWAVYVDVELLVTSH